MKEEAVGQQSRDNLSPFLYSRMNHYDVYDHGLKAKLMSVPCNSQTDGSADTSFSQPVFPPDDHLEDLLLRNEVSSQ